MKKKVIFLFAMIFILLKSLSAEDGFTKLMNYLAFGGSFEKNEKVELPPFTAHVINVQNVLGMNRYFVAINDTSGALKPFYIETDQNLSLMDVDWENTISSEYILRYSDTTQYFNNGVPRTTVLFRVGDYKTEKKNPLQVSKNNDVKNGSKIKITESNAENILASVDENYEITIIIEEQINPAILCPALKKAKCSITLDLSNIENLAEVGTKAFEGCSRITKVLLPADVKKIGASAFKDCKRLKSIILPETLTSIGEKAFYDCSSLSTIDLPSGLSFIGNYAFSLCPLEIISIPKKISTIEAGMFSQCKFLRDINLSDGVLAIQDKAFFKCTSLENINIPDSVQKFGKNVFAECSSLKNIQLSKNLRSTGEAVFANCTNLSSVDLPDSLITLNNEFFSGCINLESVKMGNNITSIGGHAFDGCKKISTITLPVVLTSIYEYAFQNCVSLKSIIIPSSVNMLGNAIFAGCKSHEELKVSPQNKYYTSVNNVIYTKDRKTVVCSAGGIKNAVLPYGVTKLQKGAFKGTDNMISLTLPDTINDIGDDSLGYKKQIIVNIHPGTNAIEARLCKNCPWITDVVIPEGVTAIGDEAFYNCKGLKAIKLPDSLKTIGNGAFYKCSGLKIVELPDSVKTVGNEAFSYCEGLLSFTVGANVTSIGYDAFFGCKRLQNLSFNNSKGWQYKDDTNILDMSDSSVNAERCKKRNRGLYKW